jgi:hypothetical protein
MFMFDAHNYMLSSLVTTCVCVDLVDSSATFTLSFMLPRVHCILIFCKLTSLLFTGMSCIGVVNEFLETIL